MTSLSEAAEQRWTITAKGRKYLEALDDYAEAAHQAAKDRAREPDRWPARRARARRAHDTRTCTRYDCRECEEAWIARRMGEGA